MAVRLPDDLMLTCPRCGRHRIGVAEKYPGLHCEHCGLTESFSHEIPNHKQYTGSLVEAFTIHSLVDLFAERATELGMERHEENHPFPLAGGALHSLSADMLTLHRSVGTLTATGWTATAPLLLRAQLEVFMNSVVIWNADNEKEYMGFRYTHGFLFESFRDQTVSAAERVETKAQIDHGISRLPTEFQAKATETAYKSKLPGYWYQPEFSNPKAVMEKYAKKEIRRVYRALSSSAHGGFLGFRQFRDDSDNIHAEARDNPHSEARAMMISSMLTLDQSHVRTLIDDVTSDTKFQALRDAVAFYGQRQLQGFLDLQEDEQLFEDES